MEKKQCDLEILTVSTTVFLTGRGHGPHVFYDFFLYRGFDVYHYLFCISSFFAICHCH